MVHPFRCWKPHISGGTLDGLFPRHTAQILSVERFLFPPMPQCLLYRGASRITCLLLTDWNGISVRTPTGAELGRASITAATHANVRASQAWSTGPKEAMAGLRSLTPWIQCFPQGSQHSDSKVKAPWNAYKGAVAFLVPNLSFWKYVPIGPWYYIM